MKFSITKSPIFRRLWLLTTKSVFWWQKHTPSSKILVTKNFFAKSFVLTFGNETILSHNFFLTEYIIQRWNSFVAKCIISCQNVRLFFFFFKLLATKPFCHLMFSLLNKLFKDKTILLPNVLFHFTLLNYIWRWKISLPKPFFKKKKLAIYDNKIFHRRNQILSFIF